jgi:hypothetical protein
MSDDEMAKLTMGVKSDFSHIRQDLDEVREALLRKKLEDVLPAISISYFAKHYFGKSTSWFYQRMNGNKVNGKVAAFTQAELRTLADALDDVGRRLSAVSLTL